MIRPPFYTTCLKCGTVITRHQICWKCEEEKVKLNQEMLRCQFTCGGIIDACSYCDLNIECHTTKSRRFMYTRYYSGYSRVMVYAESQEEIHEMLWEYGEELFQPWDSNESSEDSDIEELDYEYKPINSAYK